MPGRTRRSWVNRLRAPFSSEMASEPLMGNCSENRGPSGAGALTGISTSARHVATEYVEFARPRRALPTYVGIAAKREGAARFSSEMASGALMRTCSENRRSLLRKSPAEWCRCPHRHSPGVTIRPAGPAHVFIRNGERAAHGVLVRVPTYVGILASTPTLPHPDVPREKNGSAPDLAVVLATLRSLASR
jgi:hypothetical protein